MVDIGRKLYSYSYICEFTMHGQTWTTLIINTFDAAKLT